MKSRIDIKSLGFGAFLGAIIVFSLGAVTEGTKSSWDYRVVSGQALYGDELENRINAAVTEGWDFVSASNVGTDRSAFAIMRRAKK